MSPSVVVAASKLVLKCRLLLQPKPVELNVLMDCQQSKTCIGLKSFPQDKIYIDTIIGINKKLN